MINIADHFNITLKHSPCLLNKLHTYEPKRKTLAYAGNYNILNDSQIDINLHTMIDKIPSAGENDSQIDINLLTMIYKILSADEKIFCLKQLHRNHQFRYKNKQN